MFYFVCCRCLFKFLYFLRYFQRILTDICFAVYISILIHFFIEKYSILSLIDTSFENVKIYIFDDITRLENYTQD